MIYPFFQPKNYNLDFVFFQHLIDVYFLKLYRMTYGLCLCFCRIVYLFNFNVYM